MQNAHSPLQQCEEHTDLRHLCVTSDSSRLGLGLGLGSGKHWSARSNPWKSSVSLKAFQMKNVSETSVFIPSKDKPQKDHKMPAASSLHQFPVQTKSKSIHMIGWRNIGKRGGNSLATRPNWTDNAIGRT